TKVGLETRAVELGQRSLEVVGDDLHQLLAGHLSLSVVVHLCLLTSIRASTYVTHCHRSSSRGLREGGCGRGAGARAGWPRSNQARRKLRPPAIPAHREAPPRRVAPAASDPA